MLRTTDVLSNRQQLILAAAVKMLTGTKMYEDGFTEFSHLTGDEQASGRKQGSGGRDVTKNVRQIAETSSVSTRARRKKLRSAPSVREDLHTKVLAAIKSGSFVTLHSIAKRYKIGWMTAKKAADKLINAGQIEIVSEARPGAKKPSKRLVLHRAG